MATRGGERWRIEEYGQPCEAERRTIDFSGLSVSVNAPAAPGFEALGDLFSAEYGRALDRTQTGSYNCRHIGSNSSKPWSAHAWALAIDIDWRLNPYKKPLTTVIPNSLRDIGPRIRTKETNTAVFRWGGGWSTPDPMHYEIMATPKEIAEGIVVDGSPSAAQGGEVMKHGDSGPRVEWWQQRLVDWKPGIIEVDGLFGEKTEQAVKDFEKAKSIPEKGVIDLTRAAALVATTSPGPSAMTWLLAMDATALAADLSGAEQSDWPPD